MPYLITETDDEGEVLVYPELIVVVEFTNKQAFFDCTTGVHSYVKLWKWQVERWLGEHGIDFFSISKQKIACKPHVLGPRTDASLIYNPCFYKHLPDEVKRNYFACHSFSKAYVKALRKGSANKRLKKLKRTPKVKKQPSQVAKTSFEGAKCSHCVAKKTAVSLKPTFAGSNSKSLSKKKK
jgi:hypothetical protein